MNRVYLHPATHILEDFEKKTSVSDKLECLILAFEFVIRIDTLILAGALLEKKGEFEEYLVSEIFRKNIPLGGWFHLNKVLVSRIDSKEIFPLVDWCLKMNKQGILNKLIALRNNKAHKEDRTQANFNEKLLENFEGLFFESYRKHPKVNLFEDRNNKLFLIYNDCSICCYPFLLPGSIVNDFEHLLIYRGISGENLSYATVSGKEYLDPSEFKDIRFRQKSITQIDNIDLDKNWIDIIPRIKENSHRTIARLEDMHRYNSTRFLKRDLLESSINEFLNNTKKLLIVSGSYGSGKTCLCANLSNTRLSNNDLVFFETADRFSNLCFPESISSHLNVKGNLSIALEKIANLSNDKRFTIIIDGIGINGNEKECLINVFNWIERISNDSNLKVILTIRSNLLDSFLDSHSNSISYNVIEVMNMPSLDTSELISLAELITINDSNLENREAILHSRKSIAVRISEIGSDSIKKPGLACAIIQDVANITNRLDFSEISVLKQIYERYIIGDSINGKLKYPYKQIIVKKLAAVLFQNGNLSICIESPELASINIFQNGLRCNDYEGLINDGILSEKLEFYSYYISFNNTRLYEFIAALQFINFDFEDVILKITEELNKNQDAISIAAFYIILNLNKISEKQFDTILNYFGASFDKLLFEITLIDYKTFQHIYKYLSKSTALVLNLSKTLLKENEPLLAIDTANLILRNFPTVSEEKEAKYILLSSYEYMDDWQNAERVIDTMENIDNKILLTRADIAVTKGLFEKALELLSQVLTSDDSIEIKAISMREIGYCKMKLENFDEARSYLENSIKEFENNDLIDRNLAEAYTDLGELCLVTNYLDEAKSSFMKSLKINTSIKNYGGIGIVNGHLGNYELRMKNYVESEILLKTALDMSRKTRNRWREAWILSKLSELYREINNPIKSFEFSKESQKLFREIGSSRQ